MLNPGDHFCAIYDDKDELARIVGDFLAEGLRKSERCVVDPEQVTAKLERLKPRRA